MVVFNPIRMNKSCETETIKSPKKVKPLAPILSDKAPLVVTITIAIGTHISINQTLKKKVSKYLVNKKEVMYS